MPPCPAIAAETRVNGPDIDDARYTAYPAISPLGVCQPSPRRPDGDPHRGAHAEFALPSTARAWMVTKPADSVVHLQVHISRPPVARLSRCQSSVRPYPLSRRRRWGSAANGGVRVANLNGKGQLVTQGHHHP